MLPFEMKRVWRPPFLFVFFTRYAYKKNILQVEHILDGKSCII